MENERSLYASLECDAECLAALAHEANRAYCSLLGDDSALPWELAPEWQRESARAGIDLVLEGAGPEASHEAWSAEKRHNGWVYGEVKDSINKTHPCLVPYGDLPEHQRVKDLVYVSVVRGALAVCGVEV